jgi:hypothetical protein
MGLPYMLIPLIPGTVSNRPAVQTAFLMLIALIPESQQPVSSTMGTAYMLIALIPGTVSNRSAVQWEMRICALVSVGPPKTSHFYNNN